MFDLAPEEKYMPIEDPNSDDPVEFLFKCRAYFARRFPKFQDYLEYQRRETEKMIAEGIIDPNRLIGYPKKGGGIVTDPLWENWDKE